VLYLADNGLVTGICPGVSVSSQVVTYQLDDSTTVMFEVEPADGFRPAGSKEIAGKVREAIGPAVEAAQIVLDQVRKLAPDEVEVTFGIKVTGGAQWIVAKAAGEASFEITLTWSPQSESPEKPDPVQAADPEGPEAGESPEPASP
jgi:hypothetical protein